MEVPRDADVFGRGERMTEEEMLEAESFWCENCLRFPLMTTIFAVTEKGRSMVMVEIVGMYKALLCMLIFVIGSLLIVTIALLAILAIMRISGKMKGGEQK